MDIGEVTQIVTLLVSVLAIIWHQQRSTKELRREFREDNRALRGEFRRENKKLRRDFERAHGELRADHGELRRAFQKMAEAVADNGRKLARIEGFLGIGMPAPAAAGAPGADWAPPQDPPRPVPRPAARDRAGGPRPRLASARLGAPASLLQAVRARLFARPLR